MPRAEGEDPTRQLPSIEELLLAILTILVDLRVSSLGEQEDSKRVEILLESAGLTPQVIGPMVGKSPGAVRMLLLRARTPKDPKKKG